MARIRTIKPEFFTSEDIVALSPMARLLYIATWCEADKEGRLPWKPMTFKLRYFPGDNCDIQVMCKELVDSGLVKLYGEGLAHIPQFGKHQHINPRESASILPEPEGPRVATRRHASERVNSGIDPQVGREGKGKEGKEESRVVDAFETFYLAYPNKVGKDAARKAFDKRKPDSELLAMMLAAIAVQAKSPAWTKDAGQFIPHPATWLNQGRWQDEGASPEVAAKRGSDEYAALHKTAAWWRDAGFDTVWDAMAVKCWHDNAHQFADGKRVEVAA